MAERAAAIVGIAGPALANEEAALFRAHPPAGVILFARNVQDPGQLAALTAALRDALPPEAVLMVDQEGGRVARLKPPHWHAHPPAAAIGTRYASDPEAGRRAAWLTGALIGMECADAGFDVVTAPVLDRRIAGASAGIGDRAYSDDAEAVGVLGAAMAAGLLAAGIRPVIKHAPGHGRALVDSHQGLPRVTAADLEPDIRPFAMNRNLPWAMTAHILYEALDPERPATLSPRVIGEVIRGRIGFEGVLVSDDLAMGALSGEPAARAVGALQAGCDLALYCTGEPAPTAAVLAACPALTRAAAERMGAAAALARARRQQLDAEALAAERDRLLA
jgi:beta-N-acetylhexosaminidase